MSDLLAGWLALRESADHASRSETLTRRIVDAVGTVEPVSVCDLATGTGSNLRFLASRLPPRQRWLLVDRDPDLLSEGLRRTAAWAAARDSEFHRHASGGVIRGDRLECHVETRCVDLGSLDDPGLFEGRHLVTASALLDLVSERWLRRLARQCRIARAAALFTITYNGRSSCSPAEPEDEMIRGLMNQHQKRDKGLGGPAAGPDATAVAEQCFSDEGYAVQLAPSDWVLDPDDRRAGVVEDGPAFPLEQGGRRARLEADHHEFQRQLIAGWAAAAVEQRPERAREIEDWKVRRFEHVEAGRSRLSVGHDDLAAWLR